MNYKKEKWQLKKHQRVLFDSSKKDQREKEKGSTLRLDPLSLKGLKITKNCILDKGKNLLFLSSLFPVFFFSGIVLSELERVII